MEDLMGEMYGWSDVGDMCFVVQSRLLGVNLIAIMLRRLQPT